MKRKNLKERLKQLEHDLESWKNMLQKSLMTNSERITKLERKLSSFRTSIGQCNSNLGEWVLKFGSKIEALELVLKQGFDSIATYFAKMDQVDFALDLRKLLKRLSDEQSNIIASSKEQEQNPSVKETIKGVLSDLRMTCLGCNKSYKVAELRFNWFFDKIYCPDCKHEFKTLKIRR